MDMYYKICFTIIAVGFIGCVINTLLMLKWNKLSNHTYSTIPAAIGFVAILIRLFVL